MSRPSTSRSRLALGLVGVLLLVLLAPAQAQAQRSSSTGSSNGTSTVWGDGRLGAWPVTGTVGRLAAPATTLSLTLSSTSTVYGRAVRLTARLSRSLGGTPVAGEVVGIWAAPAGTTRWVQVATGTTASTGVVTTTWTPASHSDVVARAVGSPLAAPSSSAVHRVLVAAALTARLDAAAVRVGTSTAVRGTVSPAHPGRPVTLWRYSYGAWRPVATRALSSTSTYAFSVTPSTPGWWRYRVTTPADADHGAATAVLPALDAYRLHTYSVTTKGSVVVDMAAVGSTVAATFADARGWKRGHQRFTRVATGGSFTVVMSQARYLPSFSPVCSVSYSCRVGRYVILNQDRWRWGSSAFPGSLLQYRQMVVNHETGHWLGLGHQSCPRVGTPAPVMQQQSIAMQGCTPNAWPLAAELARLR